MTTKQQAFEQALHCAKCGERATFVEEHSGTEYSPGEIILIACPSTFCKERTSFYCRSCQTKCYLNGLKRHGTSKRHIQKHAIKYPTPDIKATTGLSPPVEEPLPAAFPGIGETTDATATNMNNVMDADDILDESYDADLATTYIENGQGPMEVCPISNTARGVEFPKIPIDGNEWLQLALKDTRTATVQELFGAFGRPEQQCMKNFWVAELGSGNGRCGGGLMLLAGRAFQQVKDSQLDKERFPDYEEARWQVNNLIQFQSMNDLQRLRQSRINKTLMKYFQPEMFFKQTLLPPHNQLGRYYGTSGQHSMWNNLPCPEATDVDGVAYIGPRAIISFLMANGIPIDDIMVTANTPVRTGLDHLRRVHNVDDSQKAVEWFRDIQNRYYGSKNGAPNSNSGAPKYPAVVCLHLSDWTDGFDSAKVKSNRNAIDCMTMTVSPPKCLINGTDNTFPVALGLKKAKGWWKVSKLFRAEIDELASSSEPILFYHGSIQKMVPCMFRQFAVLSDKAERNGLTGTLGCGSNIHRCFGVSALVETPSCKIPELESFLRKEQKGQVKGHPGWSHDFVNVHNNPNGAILPSCLKCREKGVQKLLSTPSGQQRATSCNLCRNWDLLSPKKLFFPAHKDYPRAITPGSPVNPPKGRDVFREVAALPVMKLSWEVMKDGCKFAFYQASRPQKYWTKATTTAYLKHCGVANGLADLLYTAARTSCKAKEQDSINYNRPDGIGIFEFHPAWLSQQVTLQDFIEAIMHQLFLGAAESNYELIGTWLSDTPSAAKLGHNTFLNSVQFLLQDLRVFHISWLLAYPMTGKKGKLGTGSWVAENWVCFVRISQFIYGWCVRDHQNASKYGVEDMSRMVIAFHAFVARCLTHAGVDRQSIAETELYMKEFLSALREFDVRVRYSKLNKTTTKVSEKKGTEAWWLKPNYMSLSNLLLMMEVIGPLVLWWDGGGKGERFIQVIKPHIKKGVREDASRFFVKLLEKLYRVRQLDLFEKRYGLEDTMDDGAINEDLELAFSEIINDIAEAMSEKEQETTVMERGSDSEDDKDDNSSEEEEEEEEDHSLEDEKDQEPELPTEVTFDETYFSSNQAHGMTKGKTIYIYRNEKCLNESIAALKPIAGVVEVSVSNNSETIFEFFTVHRKPVKQFARRKVHFDDGQGLFFHGLWCAKIHVEEEQVPSTSSFADIQRSAKLSAVAIPLWYIIGKNKPHSGAYCVITNWWKYRMSDGTYRLPTLDPKLYDIDDDDLESYLTAAATNSEVLEDSTNGEHHVLGRL